MTMQQMLLGGASYVAEANLYFARLATEGQVLNAKRKGIINAHFKQLLATNGGWSKLRGLLICTLPAQVQSQVNALDPAEALAEIKGTPRFRANVGWDANGANGRHLCSSKLLGGYTGLTNTSSHIGVVASNCDTGNSVIAGAYIGAGGSGANYTYSIAPNVSASAAYWRICDQNAYSRGGGAAAGSFIANRDGATSKGFINGVYVGGTGASPTPVIGHQFGAPGIPNISSTSNTGNIEIAHWGLALTDTEAANISTILNSLATALKAA